MTTQVYEMQSHNSPWTEIYDMYCEREDSATGTSMADEQAEQEPTHNALADVYNRDNTKTDSKRF